jgi:putative acetyltransferase
MITFRLEKPGDAPKIYDLIKKTYGRVDEAMLVENLIADGDALISVVAMDEEDLVGHVMFSDTPVGTTKDLLRGAAMAPLSVSGLHQGQGIGGGLVIHGLRECRTAGLEVVLVLGEPEYYKRFGFTAEVAAELDSPYAGYAFQALELQPGILDGVTGKVLYPEAFNKLT